LLGTEGCAANGFDTFDQIHFWKTPVANCGNGQVTVSLTTAGLRIHKDSWSIVCKIFNPRAIFGAAGTYGEVQMSDNIAIEFKNVSRVFLSNRKN